MAHLLGLYCTLLAIIWYLVLFIIIAVLSKCLCNTKNKTFSKILVENLKTILKSNCCIRIYYSLCIFLHILIYYQFFIKHLFYVILGMNPIVFCFRVKFYPQEPYRLREEITRFETITSITFYVIK